MATPLAIGVRILILLSVTAAAAKSVVYIQIGRIHERGLESE